MVGKAKGPTVAGTVDPLTLSGGPSVEVLSERVKDAVNPPGLFRTEDHRYYWNGEGPYPSVTTVLKVLDKPAVTAWVARESVRALMLAVDNGWITHWFMDEEGVDWDGLIGWATNQPKETTDVAAALGTSVHTFADMEARADGTAATGFQMPDEVKPYLQGFRGFLGFLEAQGGTIVSSEKGVFNLGEGYGGTYDLLVTLPGDGTSPGQEPPPDLWLLDVKTSRYPYPEYALQLAGYGMAEFIALEGDPTQYPMPHVDRYGILHLRPDAYPDTGWRLIEYPIDDRDRLAFLAALCIWQWNKEGRYTRGILNKAIYAGTDKTE